MLSIIIPCYNNSDFLLKMINCFRNQTSDDWEMIIVDDGSTDETPHIVREFIKDSVQISFFERNREPKGSVVCRNIGFEKAKGTYVCHLDADDLVSPTFVEKRVAFMDEHQDCDYASFPAVCFSDEAFIPKEDKASFCFGIPKKYDDILESFLRYDYCFSTWNNIYRRKSLFDCPWDENVKIYTDFSFIVPCILKGLKHSFCSLDEADYFYRVNHSNNAMTASFVSKEKNESTLYLISKTLKQLKQSKDFRKRKKQYLGFIIAHYERLLFAKDNVYLNKMENLLSKEYSAITVQRFKCARFFSSLFCYKKYVLCIVITLFLLDSQYIEEVYRRIKRFKINA